MVLEIIDFNMYEQILIHVTGADYPGSLATIVELLEQLNISIIDVQQTTSLKQLSLSLMLSVPSESGLLALKELTALIKKLNLTIDISILGTTPWQYDTPSELYAVTILSEQIKTQYFKEIVQVIARYNMNIERMNQLAHGDLQCIEFIISMPQAKTFAFSEVQKHLFEVALQHNFNIAIQPDNLYRKSKRLVILDMDSTLIQQEVIDELANFAGVGDEVANITKEAMEGKLDFRQALYKRVSLLEGLSIEDMNKVRDIIRLTPGAKFLISVLKKLGFKIGVISGGFSYFTDHLKEQLQLDYSFANTLVLKDGKLTGELEGDIIDRSKKASLLKQLSEYEKIALDQTIAIGDGANDIDMLATAGLGIAFNAKPIVRKQAGAFLNMSSLDNVLFLLGVSQKELNTFKIMLSDNEV